MSSTRELVKKKHFQKAERRAWRGKGRRRSKCVSVPKQRHLTSDAKRYFEELLTEQLKRREQAAAAKLATKSAKPTAKTESAPASDPYHWWCFSSTHGPFGYTNSASSGTCVCGAKAPWCTPEQKEAKKAAQAEAPVTEPATASAPCNWWCKHLSHRVTVPNFSTDTECFNRCGTKAPWAGQKKAPSLGEQSGGFIATTADGKKHWCSDL